MTAQPKSGSKYIFSGKCFESDEVLLTLATAYCIPVQNVDWMRSVFAMAYCKHHGATSVITEAAKERIAVDLKEYHVTGLPPYYVKRQRLEIEPAYPIKNTDQI